MEYLGMSTPSTVHSELFSGSMTSVDTSQSEETLHQGAKSGTSQTTSFTVNMAARTWSRRSGSSTVASIGVKLAQKKTPVVSGFFRLILFDGTVNDAMEARARVRETTYYSQSRPSVPVVNGLMNSFFEN